MPALRPDPPRLGLLRGTSATSWYDTGCRLEATDRRAAIAAYERAVAGCPGLAEAYNNLGRLIHDTGDTGDTGNSGDSEDTGDARDAGNSGSPSAAEACYRLAICADPGVALYWFNLGVAVEDQGRHAEAIAAYERAVELDVDAADAYFNLARLLELKARRIGDDAMLRCAVRHLLRYRELARRTASAR